LFPLKVLRVNLADVLNNFHPDAKRLESFTVDHVNLCAGAKFTGKFLERWLEIVLAKENARQL
jgi:hypothetical protein